MPRGDQTGPWGMGSMTGRAMGYCAGFPVAGYLNPGIGRGFGRGRGFRGFWGRGGGRGRYFAGGYPFWGGAGYGAPWATAPYPAPNYPAATASRYGEMELLKEQASYFENALSDIKERISELEAKGKKE